LIKIDADTKQNDLLQHLSGSLSLFGAATGNLWFRQWSTLYGENVFCQLDNGLFGLPPIGTRVGDCVFLLLGWYKPLVFQSLETEKNKFVLLGPSYVHVVMKGEALKMEIWKLVEICIL
jgi:hypothetical protein